MSISKPILKLFTKLSKPLLLITSGILIGSTFFYLFEFKVSPSSRVLSLLGKTPPVEVTLDYPSLATIVTPVDGYSIPIRWGDLGIRLVQAGGIDLAKYNENYQGDAYKDELTYLTEDKGDAGFTITESNAYFWVNTLWALGLTQRSQVLDEGIMGTEYKDEIGSFASTGGWTLGSSDAVKLYSSVPLITLSSEQEEKVMEIAGNIYRPCCNNPTSFPDCNHGMAMLGIIELMVSQGISDEEIYQSALALNSYWFSSTYTDLAYYFATEQGLAWEEVDPQLVLSEQYSSASGYGNIKKSLGNIPGSSSGGGSCGA